MDSPAVEGYLLRVDKAAFIPTALLSGIGIIVTSLFIALNVKYREFKLLKMTSPNLNLVMLCGAILLFTSVILFGATAWLSESPTQEALNLIWKFNHSGIWLASVGFTLFFAPLAAKTWRVHRIFTDAAVKGRVIKDDKLLCFVALLAIFDLGFLALWFGLDAPVCQVTPSNAVPGFLPYMPNAVESTSPTSPSVTSSMTSDYVSACSSKFTPLWIIILAAYKSAILYYIIYVAWSTRYVTLPSMKDAGGLIISVFVTFTSFCVATPFVTSLHRWPSAQYLMKSAAILLPTYTVMFLHFLPKFLLVRRHNKDEILTRSFSQYTTPSKPEFTEDEIRDLAIQNASLRKEVAEKQRRYKSVLEQLRVAKAKLFEYSVMTSDSVDLLPRSATTDDVTCRSIETESSPMTSTETDSLKVEDDVKTKKGSMSKKEKKQNKKILKKLAKNKNNAVDDVIKMTQAVEMTSENSLSVIPGDDESTNADPNPDTTVEVNLIPDELAKTNNDVGVTSSTCYDGHTDLNTNDAKEVLQSPKHRHVSFTDLPPYRESKDRRTANGPYSAHHKSHPTLSSNTASQRAVMPSIGKNSWDYYTRGTGYLKYKATVLNHGVNGTIAAITGYPVTEPKARTMPRHNMDNDETKGVKERIPVHSTPVFTDITSAEQIEMNKIVGKKGKQFRYYTTSANSRSPSTSTDMTSSVVGHSNDETSTSNSNLHSTDQNTTKLHTTLSSNDTDVPSANSAFSVVNSKEKKPFSGFNDVTVTSPNHHSNKLLYDDYSSDSDSDDYDDSTTSMDSITCELFPPLTPRHKHYLRSYDVMQAKYLAQREKNRKRQRKAQHSEKSEGYSSGHDDKDNVRNGVTSSKMSNGCSRTKQLDRMYSGKDRRRLLGRVANKSDDGLMYDSITSTDSDSDSDWGDSATLQKCWQKVAEQGRLPLLQAGPITYSHTHRDGIFV